VSWPTGRQRDGGLDRITLPPDVPGQLWLCGKHVVGPNPEAVRSQLGERTVVVSFNQPRDISRYDGYAAWLGSSPDARWLPVPDFHAPPLDDALPLLEDVAGLLRDGRPVVMHCSAGIGRAGTMAVATLMMLGVPWSDALARVAQERKGAGPEVGSQSHLIDELATHLRGS
jgi:hypothetical protein